MSLFENKTLMITGGTGSFGNAVLNRFLRTDCKLCSNGMPVPLLRNGYSIFNGTKYR